MRILLILLALVSTIAFSQPAAKKSEDKKAVSSDTTGNNQGSTSPSSVVINVTGNTQSVENSCKTTDCKTEPEKSWWTKFWSDPIATFTGALFLATAALIGTGIMQWRETRNVAKKQLRAYLGTTPQDVKFLIVPGKNYIQTYIDIENTGATPAKDVEQWDRWEIMPPNSTEFPDAVKLAARRPIVPGGKWSLGFEKSLTAEELQGLIDEKLALYVWGRTEYRDTFGDKHWITYRYRNFGKVFVNNDKGETSLAGWAWHVETDGNETS